MVDHETELSVAVGYPTMIDSEGVPKRLSSKAFLICNAEWSWSPAHSRSDAYWLHSGNREWFLWLSFYDDCLGRMEENIIGRMPKNKLTMENAAMLLLEAFWRFDKNECDIDRPHYCGAGTLPQKALEDILDSVWKMESTIPKELVQAYEKTEYRVLEPLPFTLKIGHRSTKLEELYENMNVSSAGYLTAWNPFSANSSDEDNKKSQEKLLKKLALEGHPTFQAVGVDPSGVWPGEASILIPGLDREKAKSLGTEFGQNAIVWIGSDLIPQLILLR